MMARGRQRLFAGVVLTALAILGPAVAQTEALTEATGLVVTRGGSRPITAAPGENFTGEVRVERLWQGAEPSQASGASVTFSAGALTAWHTHPRGQVLIVTEGVGRVQQWGGQVTEIRVGDVVQIGANVKHWHGASPNVAMSHITVSEHLNGSAVTWMEKVTEEQYQSGPTPPAPRKPSGEKQPRLAPGLATLTDEVLYADVWERSEISPRDRSLVTLTALIVLGKTAQLPGHLNRGLDNGLRPAEASGLLPHLAIYSG